MNLALAVSWPRRWMRVFSTTPMAFLFAHADAVYSHTSARERALARVCYGSLVLGALARFLCGALMRWA